MKKYFSNQQPSPLENISGKPDSISQRMHNFSSLLLGARRPSVM